MAIRNQQEILLSNINKAQGGEGSEYVVTLVDDSVANDAETNLHTGPFFAILALEATVIDVSECATNIKQGGDGSTGTEGTMRDVYSNITIPIGVTVYGNFDSIELDSGKALLYSKSGTTVTVASS